MAIIGKMTIKGGKELQRKLRQLEPKLAKKVFRQALRAGAKIIRDQARAKAPVDTGLTRSAIKVRADKRRKNRIGVNVQVGEGDYKGETFYAAFLEYGHFLGSRKLGNDREFVEAKPFMRPAFDEKKEQAAQAVVGDLRKRIEAEAGK